MAETYDGEIPRPKLLSSFDSHKFYSAKSP